MNPVEQSSANGASTLAVPIPDNVTVCITSCGRLDLLAKTMTAFRQHNLSGRFLISEDSTDPATIARVTEDYPFATILSGPERLGIMGSIDRLYSVVETEYILHLEDDWVFDGPVNWDAAFAMLHQGRQANGVDVVNVCVRAFDEIKPHWRRHSDEVTVGGQAFAVMHPDAHPEFFGWSPNPGLIKRAFYQKYAPFSRVMPDQMSGIAKKDGGAMAFMLPGVARHIGAGRNVTDPTMPARPKSRPAKWLRRIKKQFYYWGLRKDPF
jgi:hypothetical protein